MLFSRKEKYLQTDLFLEFEINEVVILLGVPILSSYAHFFCIKSSSLANPTTLDTKRMPQDTLLVHIHRPVPLAN